MTMILSLNCLWTKHIIDFNFTGEEEKLPGMDFGNDCVFPTSGPMIKESKSKATNEKSKNSKRSKKQ